jgi:ABC-type multidrug transport system ATPase subunit
MNHIILEGIGKKFGRQQIFSGISFSISGGEHMAIIGYNGSGKSTLLQLIAGYITPSQGNIKYIIKEKQIQDDQYNRHISYSAPYLELIEEYTLSEMIDFYFSFKYLSRDIIKSSIPEMAELGHAKHKQVKFFSSGMKQRLKLILAILSDVPFVFLDEPVSNLDKPGIKWYREMIRLYAADKILLISSNEVKDEMEFCSRILRIEDYKKQPGGR